MKEKARVSRLRILMLLAGPLFAGCAAALPDNRSLPVEDACLVSDEAAFPITIEIARSPGERSRGLMERNSLAAKSGMLFVYREQRPATYGFWMYKTLIPLDIAYLDRDGTIVAIRQMPPCPPHKGTDCPAYPAGAPFYLALEMNQGYFESRGLEAGDRLSRSPSDCR